MVQVLHLGFNILLCDVDAVWLKSPIPYVIASPIFLCISTLVTSCHHNRYLSHGYDIQSQPENDGRLCGGFMCVDLDCARSASAYLLVLKWLVAGSC